jgi:hypothetical protein
MAHALAAMCPPLKTRDVMRAANELTAHTKPTHVIEQLLHRKADLLNARRVVEALQALGELQP